MNLAPSELLGQRHAGLREAMAAAACDVLLVTRRPNLFYLTNFGGSAGAAVLTAAGLSLVVDFRYLTEARALLASGFRPPQTTLVPVTASYDETIAALLNASGGHRLAFEADDLSVSRHAWLAARLSAGAALQPTSGMVERLRERKDRHEQAVLREAAGRIAAVAAHVRGEVRAGRTEREVAGAIEAAMRSSGFSRPAFDTIVASGPNAALPHATAGERVIRPGDLVVLDFGGVFEGYCVDLTRTVSVGPPDAEARRVYGAVRAAQRAAIDAVRPGVLTGDVDAAARRVLEGEGLGEAFGHATGHGLGLEVHEGPRVTRRRSGGAATEGGPGLARLEPGMVFTIEPGAYLPGWGGVRIEDDVLVTEAGGEVLTRPWGQDLTDVSRF